MNYADIKTIDVQDGTGVRVSIYVSGCHFHCKGCHNKEAWDFNYGKKFDESTIEYILGLLDHDYISGLSILGGEPMEPVNQQGLVPLVKAVKEKFPNKDIWCYTGYRFEEDLLNDMYEKNAYTKEILNHIDIMVDGQFIEEQKLVNLKFRGSTNQKKIDVQASLKEGKAVQLRFGDEERYESKDSKIVVFKEFKTRKEESTPLADGTSAISAKNVEVTNDNIISITPAFEIKPVEAKIAAENIKENDDINV